MEGEGEGGREGERGRGAPKEMRKHGIRGAVGFSYGGERAEPT